MGDGELKNEEEAKKIESHTTLYEKGSTNPESTIDITVLDSNGPYVRTLNC